MARDGSLFGTLLIFIIYVAIFFGTGLRNAPVSIAPFLLIFYSFLVPNILASQWRLGEFNNLWIPLTTIDGLEKTLKALLYDLILLSYAIPQIILTALYAASLFSLRDSLTYTVVIASNSLIGCSLNLYTIIHFISKSRKPVSSLLLALLTMILYGLLLSPVFTYMIIMSILNIDLVTNMIVSPVIMLYSYLVYHFLSKRLTTESLKIEI
ncbi:MAG: hypothetical protein RMJ07_06110 [Nitrososphaerota archaeon]|nr:hypothetical protein [Candidatus Bathyarchaeota archaeon]MDW8049233.1 hypothetical protein [Nitrososphaerota archaeon]